MPAISLPNVPSMPHDPAATSQLSHGRSPWPSPGEMSSDQLTLYVAILAGPRAGGQPPAWLVNAAGRLEGPFNAMLLDPPVGLALQELGVALRYHSKLTDAQREIAILEIAAQTRCAFEWVVHAPLALAAGVTEQDLVAIHQGLVCCDLSPAETMARDVANRLHRRLGLDDGSFVGAREQLGVAGLMDLVVLVGYYGLLALLMEVWQTPLPFGTSDPWTT